MHYSVRTDEEFSRKRSRKMGKLNESIGRIESASGSSRRPVARCRNGSVKSNDTAPAHTRRPLPKIWALRTRSKEERKRAMKSLLNVVSFVFAISLVGALLIVQRSYQQRWSGGSTPIPPIAIVFMAIVVFAVLLVLDWMVGSIAYNRQSLRPRTESSPKREETGSIKKAA
jgi:hypothetical protein